MFTGPMETSILKKAQDKGLFSLHLINYRDYSTAKHKNVDDSPFGGGAGMVLKPEPIYNAVENNHPGDGKILLMSPQGRKFDQQLAKELAIENSLSIICGHYEGFDERIRMLADYEVSIGDYVLTGGEIPAMVVIDAVSRLLPGVLGEEESPLHDSFYNGLLEYPQYTRPRSFRGREVPEVLISGNHKQISQWRRKESLRKTRERRPDLLERTDLTIEDKKMLAEIEREALGLDE
jgi:tRNA (guanine37-N1)-methyltransferase